MPAIYSLGYFVSLLLVRAILSDMLALRPNSAASNMTGSISTQGSVSVLAAWTLVGFHQIWSTGTESGAVVATQSDVYSLDYLGCWSTFARWSDKSRYFAQLSLCTHVRCYQPKKQRSWSCGMSCDPSPFISSAEASHESDWMQTQWVEDKAVTPSISLFTAFLTYANETLFGLTKHADRGMFRIS